MLRFTIPVEKGNEAEADGSLAQAIKDLIALLEPEAAYFHLDRGMRAGTIFYEESDAARLPLANELFFSKLNASIEIQPAVSFEELMSGL